MRFLSECQVDMELYYTCVLRNIFLYNTLKVKVRLPFMVATTSLKVIIIFFFLILFYRYLYNTCTKLFV